MSSCHGLEQVGHDAGGIVGAHDRTHDGDPVRAGCNGVGGIAGIDPAEREDRNAVSVEGPRRQSMDKLKLYSVAELPRYAFREGVTSLD